MYDFASPDTITISISYVNQQSKMWCFVYTKNERTFTRIYTFIKCVGLLIELQFLTRYQNPSTIKV